MGGGSGGGGGGGQPRGARRPHVCRTRTLRGQSAQSTRLRQRGDLCKRDFNFTHLTATAGHATGHRRQNQLRLNLLSRLVPLVRHCTSAQDSESATSSAANSDRQWVSNNPPPPRPHFILVPFYTFCIDIFFCVYASTGTSRCELMSGRARYHSQHHAQCVRLCESVVRPAALCQPYVDDY